MVVTASTSLLNGQNGADEDFNDGWTFFLVTNHQIKCNKVSIFCLSHLNDSSLRKNGKTVYGHLMQIWLAFIKRLIAQQQLFNFNLKIFTDMIRNRFNPHGPFVPLGDIFPFWAKILNVFTLTCYHL